MDLAPYLHGVFDIKALQTILLFLMTFCCLFWYSKRPHNVPHGPFRWPFIGNTPMMIISRVFYKEHIHQLMTKLSKKYGRIFTFYVGIGNPKIVVVLNDVMLIKEAFKNPDLCQRPVYKGDNDLLKTQAVLFNGDDIWMHHRRFSLSIFRSFGVGKTSFDKQIAQEASRLCDAIRQSEGKPFDLKPLVMNGSSNLICSFVLGKSFEYSDEEFRQHLFTIEKRLKCSRLFNEVPPIIAKLLKSRLTRFLNWYETSTSFIRNFVEEHKNNNQNNNSNDLIDQYLKESDQNEYSSYFKEQFLIVFADLLFVAGTETSSNTLAWCFLHLISDCDYQTRIRNEINLACSDGELPTYSERSQFPFTEAFILEIQRMHTVVPLGLPHKAATDVILDGYKIPAGSVVISNLWAVHHDPDVWDDPEVFRPCRFLDQYGKVVIKQEFIPFSTGRRVCLGERIAKMEIFIFLTHLVHRFYFTKADVTSPILFEADCGLTYSPRPYEICATQIE